jgi:hypothetical protein
MIYYRFTIVVKEINTEAELLTVDHPCRCPVCCCKCCCYQTASFTSGGHALGSIQEDCFVCVPTFAVTGSQQQGLYAVIPPTCCGGICTDCCAYGNPCTRNMPACCRQSFRVYPIEQKGKSTNGDTPYIGSILQKPRSEAEGYYINVNFPKAARTDEKAILVGTALFLNGNFFECNDRTVAVW